MTFQIVIIDQFKNNENVDILYIEKNCHHDSNIMMRTYMSHFENDCEYLSVTLSKYYMIIIVNNEYPRAPEKIYLERHTFNKKSMEDISKIIHRCHSNICY
jgi:hypothetical protein